MIQDLGAGRRVAPRLDLVLERNQMVGSHTDDITFLEKGCIIGYERVD